MPVPPHTRAALHLRQTPALLAGLATLLSACSDRAPPVTASSLVTAHPSLAANAATASALTWLAPLGMGTADPARFDAGAAPVVEICAWSGTVCSGALVARFTTAPAGGDQPLTVDAAAGRYEASWSLMSASFTTRRTYRVRVLQSATELRGVSVDVVRGRWALTRSDGTLAPLASAAALPIRFHLAPRVSDPVQDMLDVQHAAAGRFDAFMQTDAPDVAFGRTVTWLRAHPRVREVTPGNLTARIRYVDGRTGGLVIVAVDESGRHLTVGGGTGVAEPRPARLLTSAAQRPAVGAPPVLDDTREAGFANAILSPTALIYSPFESRFRINFAQRIQARIAASPLQFGGAVVRTDAAADIEAFRSLWLRGLVVVLTHGVKSWALATGTRVVPGNPEPYASMIQHDSIAAATLQEYHFATKTTASLGDYYWIQPKFLEQFVRARRLPQSVIVMMACEGMESTAAGEFGPTLLQYGAKAVVGVDGRASARFAYDIADQVVRGLAVELKTVQDAFGVSVPDPLEPTTTSQLIGATLTRYYLDLHVPPGGMGASVSASRLPFTFSEPARAVVAGLNFGRPLSPVPPAPAATWYSLDPDVAVPLDQGNDTALIQARGAGSTEIVAERVVASRRVRGRLEVDITVRPDRD